MAICTGGCSCGQVRFELRGKPMFTHACHCHLCQQSTGSAFILHSLIEGDLFELTSGKLADFEGPSGSGRRHIVKRCSRCGDPIVSYFGETEHVAVVKTGALDDPNTFPPEAHIFVNTKLSWIKLTDKMPQFEGFYDFVDNSDDLFDGLYSIFVCCIFLSFVRCFSFAKCLTCCLTMDIHG